MRRRAQCKGPWTLENKNMKLCGYTSACCGTYYEKGWTKGTSCYSWLFGPKFHPTEKANTIADCLVISSTQRPVSRRQWAAGCGYSSSTDPSCKRQSPEGPRLCVVRKLIWSLKLRTAAFGSRISRNTARKKTWTHRNPVRIAIFLKIYAR